MNLDPTLLDELACCFVEAAVRSLERETPGGSDRVSHVDGAMEVEVQEHGQDTQARRRRKSRVSVSSTA